MGLKIVKSRENRETENALDTSAVGPLSRSPCLVPLLRVAWLSSRPRCIVVRIDGSIEL